MMLLAGAVVAAVLVLLVVWFFVVDKDAGGTATKPGAGDPVDAPSTPSDVDRFGVATVTDGCPAAGVTNGQARCTERPECWSSMVIIQGELTSIRQLACDQNHVFETYAIALVPPDVAEPYLDVLEAHPIVKQVCSRENMLNSLRGKAREEPERWEHSVIPPTPDDREQGYGVFRCVATDLRSEGMTEPVFGVG
jgi:hypothetical protein